MKLHKSKKDDEVYYYYLKNGEKRWMYRHKYYDALGKRKEKKKSGFKTEKEALKSLLEVKASILKYGTGHIENSEITIGKWFDVWYETNKNRWAVTTRIQRKEIIKQKIKPLLGNYKLNKLNRTTYINDYVNVLLEDFSPSSVQLFHRIFCIGINSAVESELIPRNRFNNVQIDVSRKLDNFLTPKELNIFLTAAKRDLSITAYTLILLLAYTGMRNGEALGLKWKHIDFEMKTIKIEFTRDRFGERKPKTNNSYRTIPVDDTLINQLKKYQTWCMKIKLEYGERLDKTNDNVFISRTNQLYAISNTNRAIERIYKHLKKNKIKINKISAHGLRHTHATILINDNVPVRTIADRLGNTVEMIYRVYSHSFKELEEKAVTVFAENVQFGAKSGAK